MLDQICEIVNELKEQGNYRVASVLYSIVTDLALQEERQHFAHAYEKASIEMQTLQAKLQASGLQRLASEIDVIARDLEQKAIAFSVEDPIQTVLHSYKTIHKVASIQKKASPTELALQDIIDLVESETVPDSELPQHIKTMTLGLSEQAKRDILYVLEKDYNLTLPLEKIAKKPKKHLPKTDEEQCLEEAETPKEKSECLDNHKPHLKMERSWPSAPSMWSGFAYEAIVPYHQNSQLNFWSIASNAERVLKRISKKT